MRATLAALLLLLGTFVQAAGANDSHVLFYLARIDTLADGIIDQQDISQLYVQPVDAPPQVVSLDGHDVEQFAPSPTGDQVVYETRVADTQQVYLVDLATASVTQLDTAAFSTFRLAFLDTGIWLTAVDASASVVVRGYDTTGQRMTEQVIPLPGTVVIYQPDGSHALAFNTFQASLGVLRLPSAEPVRVSLSGVPAGVPAWHPREPRYLLPLYRTEATTDLILGIADAAAATATTIDLPDLPRETLLAATWSAGGRYALVEYDNAGSLALLIIDMAAGTVQDVRPDGLTAVESWRADDQMLAVLVRAADESRLRLQLVDPAAGLLRDTPELAAYHVYTSAWSADGQSLLFAGQSALDGRYGVYRFDTDTGAVTTIFDTTDADMRRTFIYPSTPQGFVYLGPTNDLVFSDTQVPLGLYQVMLPDVLVTRLSLPDSVIDSPLDVVLR